MQAGRGGDGSGSYCQVIGPAVCLDRQNNDGETCLDKQNNREACLERQNNDACSESLVGDMEGIPEFQGSAGCTRDVTNMTPCVFFSMLVEDSMLEIFLKSSPNSF